MGFFDSDKSNAYSDIYDKLSNYKLNNPNNFANYVKPVSYTDKLKELWRTGAKLTTNTSRKNAEVLASQGITGGSAVTVANNDAAGNIADSIADQNTNLLNIENQDAFNLASAKNNEQQQTINNILQRYAALLNAAGGLDNSSGASLLANTVGGVTGLAGGLGNLYKSGIFG